MIIYKISIAFVSQLLFGLARNVNTRYVARGNAKMSVISGFFVKTLWLISTYFGIASMIDGDYMVTLAYLSGGVLGDYLSFKINIK